VGGHRYPPGSDLRDFFLKVGSRETLDHLPENPLLNDASPLVPSCDFGPCGGYPLEPLG
jgi:hypothetical protein